jgi:hypothetical protein
MKKYYKKGIFMQNKEISNENIYTFLANSQKVTKRAVSHP